MPTGRAITPVPGRVKDVEEEKVPLESTVGEAKGRAPSWLPQRRLPSDSPKACSTPSAVPLGEATTSMLVDAPLVAGMARAAVVVLAGRGADHRCTPLVMSIETRALLVMA